MLDAKETILKVKARKWDQLNNELDLARVVVGPRLIVIRNFSARLSTWFSSSLRAQAVDYRDHLNALVTDGQTRVNISAATEYVLGMKIIAFSRGILTVTSSVGGYTAPLECYGGVVVVPRRHLLLTYFLVFFITCR